MPTIAGSLLILGLFLLPLLPTGVQAMSQDIFFADLTTIRVNAFAETVEGEPLDDLASELAVMAADILFKGIPAEAGIDVQPGPDVGDILENPQKAAVLIHAGIAPAQTVCAEQDGVVVTLCLRLFRSGPSGEYGNLYPAAPVAIAGNDIREFTKTGSAENQALEQALETMLQRAVLRSFMAHDPRGPVE